MCFEKGVHMKKILCLLLSVCLVFSVVSFGASALETNETKPETDYIYLGSVDAVAFDPTTKMEATQNGISAPDFAFEGGEDYALVGTCPAPFWPELARVLSGFATPSLMLGTVRKGPLTLNGHGPQSAGFDHFSC